MSCSIVLGANDCNALLDTYRRDPDPAVRLRAHIVLLLAHGYPWATIAAVLFTSTSTIARWQTRYQEGGWEALLGRRPGCRPRYAPYWVDVVVHWITEQTPRTFGWLRSRWTCTVVAAVLLEIHQVAVSRETVRRWLHTAELVWRRPRPVLRPKDPQRAAKLRALRRLLAGLPADEAAVFEDEVDLNTNPKIGSLWMRKGQQAAVETPGTNEKRYLAGSVNWRTGALIVTEGVKRDGELFVRHLEDLRRRLRRYRVIHVICDNARFHVAARCRRVQEYLKQWGHRIRLHYLPTYAPETNPIERLWWHLHEEVTRNHKCQTLEELLEFTFAWLQGRNPFVIEGSVYPQAQAA
ncbi:MAG: IS630 family transposase [Acidobacteria bacterium]|nr:IS630 family transposase [Acidobacteriota bacterium]